MKRSAVIILLAFPVWLGFMTIRNPGFWSTPARHGDALMHDRHFKEAAETYTDPWQIGIARYRNGDFETAAKTFARVPGATGAFNQANSWLMHGAYDKAIAGYDRALGFRPGWKDAEDNKALAIARKNRIDNASENGDRLETDEDEPGEIRFDQKAHHESEPDDPPQDLAGMDMSDSALRATWLRRVATTPGDFLRAKFAYQAARSTDGKEAK